MIDSDWESYAYIGRIDRTTHYKGIGTPIQRYIISPLA